MIDMSESGKLEGEFENVPTPELKCPQLSIMDSLLISDKIGFDFAGDHV